MELRSPAFSPGEPIPRRFTCDGENISPELSWAGAPKNTKSYALIVHDPDAPRAGGFTHWLLYNIEPSLAQIPEGVSAQNTVQGVGVQGKNDSGKIGYMGPCPPSGTHRYFIWVYALSDTIDLKPGANAKEVRAAIEGKIIGQAELMGTYTRVAKKTA